MGSITEYSDLNPSVGCLIEVTASKTDDQEIVNILTEHGGVIVRGLLELKVLEQVKQDLMPYFNDQLRNDPLFSNKVSVVTGIASKSPSYIEHFIGNPLYSAVCDRLLSSSHTCWYGNEKHTFESLPQVNTAAAFLTSPGNTLQNLHRDDMGHHNRLSAITSAEYKVGRDTVVGIFVAGSQTTKENGATRFIPGSHLWDTMHPPDDSLSVYVELQPGDVFLMLGSCYHGASVNASQEQRLVYSSFMTKSVLRQEENQYLSVPVEDLRKISPRMQKRLGFAASNPLHGWVDLKDPMMLLGLEGRSDLK
ncbi:phytanoyl-CoA dioxygenase family protein, partial [Penicillium pulvis]|uniref:phytanoyl-CoA dioxygenase family protein n=1 Tax=Penicillium pulvis TaxID=1562058 RepID=UPI0025498F52